MQFRYRGLIRMMFTFGLCLGAGVAPAPGRAEGLTPSDGDKVKALYLDLSIPDSPAFAAIDEKPGQMQSPGTPRAFAVGLLQGIGEDGRFRQALAFDFSPYLQWAGNDLTLTKYKTGLHPVLSRTTLSLGSANQEGGRVQVGLGLRSTIIDKGDPRLDRELIDDFRKILALGPEPSAPPSGASVDTLKDLATELDKARARARSRNWNRMRWDVGAALRSESPTGEVKLLRGDGGARWSSLGLRLRRWGQLVLFGKWSEVSHGDSTGTVRNASARLRFGSESLAYGLEGGVFRDKRDGVSDNSWSRVALGAEFRLSNGTWLEVGLGSDLGRDGQSSRLLSLANLKWSLGEQRLLK
jgi:hypothetical protein